MTNDSNTFEKIREGDIKAFEKVFRQYYSPVCRYAGSITGRKEIAEEIVQEVFYNIWKEREKINLRSSMESYLYGAVKNHALRYRESLAIMRRYHDYVVYNRSGDTELSPHEQLEYSELEMSLHKTLEAMPERRRQIFRLHREEGEKYTEIAESLSISVKTVEAEMTKAYRALRLEFEKYIK
jgi:RNA polymerase sigma-70 factor (ECF subfamily)